MSSKINFIGLIRDHFATMRNDRTQKLSKTDIIEAYLLPIIFSAILLYFKFTLAESILNYLITSFSIFVGLLINVLVLIYSISIDDKNMNPQKSNDLSSADTLIKEIFINISYSIIISSFCVVFSILCIIANDFQKPFITSIIIFLSINFFWTLLMILKRLHILMKFKFQNK